MQRHDFFYIAPLLGQHTMYTSTFTSIGSWSSSNAYVMQMHATKYNMTMNIAKTNSSSFLNRKI